MAALATLTDYTNIVGKACDATRVQALLETASSAVLAHAAGQQIVVGTTTDLTVEVVSGKVFLPQRPVLEVLELVDAGVLVELSELVVRAGGNGRAAVVYRRDRRPFVGPVVVSYRHGYDPVPGDIVRLVVAMVKGEIENSGGPAVAQTSETIGPFSRSSSIVRGSVTGLEVTAEMEAKLAAMFGVARSGGSYRTPRDLP